jgi:hypothetical protein
MLMFLSKDQLYELTGRRRPKAQARALSLMGIPYRRRPDGSPVVLRIHLEDSDATLRSPFGELEPVLQP